MLEGFWRIGNWMEPGVVPNLVTTLRELGLLAVAAPRSGVLAPLISAAVTGVVSAAKQAAAHGEVAEADLDRIALRVGDETDEVAEFHDGLDGVVQRGENGGGEPNARQVDEAQLGDAQVDGRGQDVDNFPDFALLADVLVEFGGDGTDEAADGFAKIKRDVLKDDAGRATEGER
jgi:hypothetical protein